MSITPALLLPDPPIYNNDPFLLQPTDPSTPKFNGTNYVRWSRAMQIALAANNKLGFIDGTIPKPPISSPDDPTYTQWLRCDCIVMSWIINSIEPQLSDAFLYASSAKQLWDDMKQKFGVSTGPLLYQLELQITNTVQGDSPVAVYYMTLNKLWDEFGSFFTFPTCTCCNGACSCGGAGRFREFERKRKLIKFLMGLDDGFDSVRAQILLMDPLPTIDTAFAMVLQVEKQRQVIHDIKSSTTESGAVHVIKSGQNANMNSYRCGYRKEVDKADYFCNQGWCTEKPGQGKPNHNAAAAYEPDRDLIDAIVQSVVQILKQKHAVGLTIPPQPDTSHQMIFAKVNELDKQQEQVQEQKKEVALVEHSGADTNKSINHADPSPDLHKDENQPALADPFFGAVSSDHNQATTPAHPISPSFVCDYYQGTTIAEHTVSPSLASSNQTTTTEHTISHLSSTSSVTTTDEKKALAGDVSTSDTISVAKKIGPYTSSQKILLVGEGDFSFSTCLAIAFGSASNMVATSLNTKAFLSKNYGNYTSNEKKLVDRGCIIIHGIDATEMAMHPQLSSTKFDCIIFNFPHAGFRSKETPNIELGRHQKLVSGFLRNARDMINKDGRIHIRHKSNGAFLKWNIPNLATDQGLVLKEESKFKPSKYPGYNTKYGFGGDKDFECRPSKTYMFGLAS